MLTKGHDNVPKSKLSKFPHDAFLIVTTFLLIHASTLRLHVTISKRLRIYLKCHAVYKASNARLACNFSAKNGVDGVEEAGFCRPNLTKKKNVCCTNVLAPVWFVRLQALSHYTHMLKKYNDYCTQNLDAMNIV